MMGDKAVKIKETNERKNEIRNIIKDNLKDVVIDKDKIRFFLDSETAYMDKVDLFRNDKKNGRVIKQDTLAVLDTDKKWGLIFTVDGLYLMVNGKSIKGEKIPYSDVIPKDLRSARWDGIVFDNVKVRFEKNKIDADKLYTLITKLEKRTTVNDEIDNFKLDFSAQYKASDLWD